MDCLPSVVELVRQLRAFHGYRTLWVDPHGTQILHAEPEDELEDLGYRYVATLMRPGPEVLAEALGRAGIRLAATTHADASAVGWSGVVGPLSA